MGCLARGTGSLPLLLLLLLDTPGRERLTVLGQVVFPTTEDCRLETGEVGHCLPLTYCPPVLQTFKQKRPVGCGFRKRVQLVCCPEGQGNRSESVQQLSDITPPRGYDALDCGRKGEILIRETLKSGSSSFLRSAANSQQQPAASLLVKRSSFGVNEPAVVGGHISFRNAWPWAALLGERDSAGINWFCGGTLINEYWVLSALHCFHDHVADVVRLGEHDYADPNDGASPKDYGVVDTEFYPDYKHPENYHDLALLKLDAKVKLQTTIHPVCLPWGQKSKEDMVNSLATIVGWGNTLQGGLPSSVLMEAIVQVFPSTRCDRSYSTLPNYAAKWPHGIGKETLCAGDPNGGKDACQGDSGGPLVSPDTRGRYVLAGVVSKGRGCGHQDFPGLYVNARHQPYLAWIKKVAF